VQLLTITYNLLAQNYSIAQSLVQISPANYAQDPVVETRVQYWLTLQYPMLPPWNPIAPIATIPQLTATSGIFDGLQFRFDLLRRLVKRSRLQHAFHGPHSQ